MSKKKKQNRTIRDKRKGITLKELIERGVVDEYYHLKEQRFVGGLTMPEKNSTDWWKKVDELSSK